MLHVSTIARGLARACTMRCEGKRVAMSPSRDLRRVRAELVGEGEEELRSEGEGKESSFIT